MQNYRDEKWANQIISMQNPDGSWMRFHTMRGDGDTPVTIEMAECIKTAGLTVLGQYDTEFASVFVAKKRASIMESR